ncbi:MAG: sugar-binding protein [Planctomycetia bacterium]|nr:sugar-binding protein [Planctomycetia bacterium]
MFMQRRSLALCASIAAAGIGFVTSVANAQTIRTYDVNFTESPPIIDGVVTAGEWDGAAAEQGGWKLLRETSRSDNQNSRWQAVWDDEAMYILFQSDYGNWSAGPSTGSINFGDDSLNLYVDPNVDGEPNVSEFAGPDGYQIAFNQYMGASAIDEGAVVTNTGIYTEAHENTTFGNQGLWEGLLNTAMAQNMSAGGGVTEIKVTWTDFDADNPDALDNIDIQGLYHNFAPEVDDTWYFNMGRITSDGGNLLPDWNVSDSQFFADRPHGEITFVKPVEGQIGDTDNDGDVDINDLNAVRNNFGNTGTAGSTAGDAFPYDGDVNINDLNGVRNNFGVGGPIPVPEPQSLVLIAIGVVGLAAYRRNRQPSC